MDTRAAFSLLGVSPGASPDAIRDAYRDLVKVWHPDRFTGDARLQAKASERMRELNEAYGIASAASGAAGAAMGAATPRAGNAGGGSTAASKPAAASAGDAPWARPFLSLDALWRSLFWAAACGAALFVVTAPAGFFAPGRGRAVTREAGPRTAEATTYTRLPESATGEATLVSRVRGTWVVVEHDRATWLPAGTRLDVQRGTLSCAPPGACDGSFQPVGASRLAMRGGTPGEAREIDVLFASPTAMLWLVRPTGDRAAMPSRVVLQAQGAASAAAIAP